jgi:GNAT superfamily N-acetyltransferase
MRCDALPCLEPSEANFKRALLVEQHHAESFLRERVVPGAEVHQDRDVVWVVHHGQTWRNAGILVRFSESSAGRRLDTLLARYRRHGRGMALWISPAATPASLPDLLQTRGLRCRKYFPAMVRMLAVHKPVRSVPGAVEIRPVTNVAEYEQTPHPAIGALTTPLRRQAFERLRTLVTEPACRTHSFVAWMQGAPVGAIELFVNGDTAGIHGLSVLERYQGRGIGSALIERGCLEATRQGATTMVLLATTEGQRLYERRGFTEVGRFGYWYRSFQRGR